MWTWTCKTVFPAKEGYREGGKGRGKMEQKMGIDRQTERQSCADSRLFVLGLGMVLGHPKTGDGYRGGGVFHFQTPPPPMMN